MGAEMTLTGLDQIVANLTSLGSKQGRVENDMLYAGAAVVQKAAERRAPRSMKRKRHLADNIKISKVRLKEGVKVVSIGPSRGDNSEFFYGKFPEYGTSKMPATPYMGPSIAEAKGEALDEMKRVGKEALGL